MSLLLRFPDPIPEKPISANPGLKFLFSCCILSSFVFSNNFCFHPVSWSEGSTVFCNLELHVLRQENLDKNLA